MDLPSDLPHNAVAVRITLESGSRRQRMDNQRTSANEVANATQPPAKARQPKLAPLHWGVRLAVLLAGGLLTVVGVAGLVLPGIQGLLTIVLGLAVISLASDWVHRKLRKLLVRWPRAHRAMESFRHRIHSWLSRSEPDDS